MNGFRVFLQIIFPKYFRYTTAFLDIFWPRYYESGIKKEVLIEVSPGLQKKKKVDLILYYLFLFLNCVYPAGYIYMDYLLSGEIQSI